jgi:AcrR family transcriptional regulator
MTDRPYHHGNLKEALVAAGVELLETEGLAALSLRAIAARAGVSHTAPRNHFGSLRGLLTAIGAEAFRRHAAFMRAGLSEAATREERLHAAMIGYVRFAREHPALFSLMFSKLYCDFDDPGLREAAGGSHAVLADIARGLDWDKAGAEDAQRRTELMLWSIVHGYTTLLLNGQVGPPSGDAQPIGIAEIMPAFRYRPEGWT